MKAKATSYKQIKEIMSFCDAFFSIIFMANLLICSLLHCSRYILQKLCQYTYLKYQQLLTLFVWLCRCDYVTFLYRCHRSITFFCFDLWDFFLTSSLMFCFRHVRGYPIIFFLSWTSWWACAILLSKRLIYFSLYWLVISGLNQFMHTQ